MEIDYELEPKDLIAFNKYVANRQKTYAPMGAIFSFVFITFLLADFIYAVFAGLADVSSLDLFLKHLLIRLVILTGLIGITLIVFYLVQLKLANHLAGLEDNGVLCRHKIILNEKELIEVTKVNTSRHSWLSVAKIEDAGNLLLITISSSATFIIPKRCFQDREHVKKFLETANYYWQNAGDSFQLSYLTEYEKSLQ